MTSVRDILRQSARPALAVDFGADFVAVRYAPPGSEWAELGAVAVQSPDFAAEMASLANDAGEITNGDLRAELWLPASQIVNLEIKDQPRLDILARRRAGEHLAEAVGIPADQMSFDLAPPQKDGRRSACATESSTVEEARVHAEAWGFVPTIITTRHAAPAFTRPPRFDAGGARRAFVAPALAAAAAILLVVVGVGLWPTEDGPHEPPAVDLETVANAPAPTSAFDPSSAEEKLALDASENAPSQLERPAPAASLEVEPNAPEGAETPLDFTVVSDTPPLSTSPEQDTPLAVQNDARIAVEDGTSGAITPEQVVERMALRDFVADQTPVEPLSSPLAATNAPETSAANLTPEADAPPSGDEAIAKADGEAAVSAALSDEPAAPPVEPLQDRAPAPETDVAQIDPAAFAEEAEQWAEAEGDAEAEAGANAPLSLTEDDTLADDDGAEPDETGVGESVENDDAETLVDLATTPLDGTEQAAGASNETETQLALLPNPAPRSDLQTGPALAESDDLDDLDIGPGPGSVLKAPTPAHRPAALDMTPSDLAVLVAPSPGHRPASIKPRVKPIVNDTRTAAAPNRGKPSGPGLSRAATLVDVIPLDDLSLLGTFGQGQTRRALLRMPTGEVVRVSRGDVVQGWVIGKIETLSMRITRGGEARTLPLAR